MLWFQSPDTAQVEGRRCRGVEPDRLGKSTSSSYAVCIPTLATAGVAGLVAGLGVFISVLGTGRAELFNAEKAVVKN